VIAFLQVFNHHYIITHWSFHDFFH